MLFVFLAVLYVMGIQCKHVRMRIKDEQKKFKDDISYQRDMAVQMATAQGEMNEGGQIEVTDMNTTNRVRHLQEVTVRQELMRNVQRNANEGGQEDRLRYPMPRDYPVQASASSLSLDNTMYNIDTSGSKLNDSVGP